MAANLFCDRCNRTSTFSTTGQEFCDSCEGGFVRPVITSQASSQEQGESFLSQIPGLIGMLLLGGLVFLMSQTAPEAFKVMGWFFIAGLVCFFLYAFFAASEPERAARRAKREEERQRKAELVAQAEQLTAKNREWVMAAYERLSQEIRAMPKYAVWREDVLKKHGRRCSICASTENIEVDHRHSLYSLIRIYKITNTQQAYECDALWEIENGNPLCKSCHDRTTTSLYRQRKLQEATA